MVVQKDRVLSYLDSNSLRPMIAVVEAKLITTHKLTLLEKGFASLVENHRKDDLRRMYELLLRVDALENIRKYFADYAKVSPPVCMRYIELRW
jgi:cullin-4